jgi:proline iminopeptidase
MQAEINGTELHYVEQGQGRGMLVMHGGLGLEHRYFRPFLDPLAEQVRLVLYDHRSHGRSGRPPIETLTHEQLVEDAEALRQHLGVGQMILFGHSYGGTLALMYALKYPQHLAGLVLCTTYPAFDYPEVIQANAAQRGTPEQLAALGRWANGEVTTDEQFGEFWETLTPMYFHRYDPAVGEALKRDAVYSGAAFNRAFGVLTPGYNVVDRLGEIQMPTLILGSRDDWITPLAQSERLHAGIRGSELVVFEHSGHFPFIEEQDAFLRTVRTWLAHVEGE